MFSNKRTEVTPSSKASNSANTRTTGKGSRPCPKMALQERHERRTLSKRDFMISYDAENRQEASCHQGVVMGETQTPKPNQAFVVEPAPSAVDDVFQIVAFRERSPDDRSQPTHHGRIRAMFVCNAFDQPRKGSFPFAHGSGMR